MEQDFEVFLRRLACLVHLVFFFAKPSRINLSLIMIPSGRSLVTVSYSINFAFCFFFDIKIATTPIGARITLYLDGRKFHEKLKNYGQ